LVGKRWQAVRKSSIMHTAVTESTRDHLSETVQVQVKAYDRAILAEFCRTRSTYTTPSTTWPRAMTDRDK
jgi:hypothetical protein